VVPDGTRKASLPEVLRPVFGRLARGGVSSENVTVVVACGTHPPVPQSALAEIIGEVPSGVTVVQHDCRASHLMVDVGTLPSGRRVSLHRAVVEADFCMTIGAVRHHYFAGFGGGPKMIFPGVAGYAEIQANHARVMDLRHVPPQRHPRCEPGVLTGNPVAEEIAAAADFLPPNLAVCLVTASDGRIASASAGGWRVSFESAVATCRSWYEVDEPPFTLAVACAGGPPSDSTLIQAHKALDAVCRFLVPGGEVLFIANLEGGTGSREMDPFVDEPSPDTILRTLKRKWVQYGHTTLRLVEKTHRYRVHLDSCLDSEIARRLGFLPVEFPDDVVDSWRDRLPGETVAVMAGSAVYPPTR